MRPCVQGQKCSKCHSVVLPCPWMYVVLGGALLHASCLKINQLHPRTFAVVWSTIALPGATLIYHKYLYSSGDYGL